MDYASLNPRDRQLYDSRLSMARSHANLFARAVLSEDLPMNLMTATLRGIAEQALLAEADFDIDPLDFVTDVETEMVLRHGDAIPLVSDEVEVVLLPLDLDIVRDIIVEWRRKRDDRTRRHPSHPDFQPDAD